MPRPHILWFRNDLRLDDNPALIHAARSSRPVVALFVLDEMSEGLRPLGGASRWWLHGSLDALGEALCRHGVPLVLRRGPALETVSAVAAETGAEAVSWNRRYGEAERRIDANVAGALRDAGIETADFNASLLFEPDEIRSKTGEPYRVFTPFWRACLERGPSQAPRDAPARILGYGGSNIPSDCLDDWQLRPSAPDWAHGLREAWRPGESGAAARLADFLECRLADYAEGRDFPSRATTSLLSPHLRFGEISPRRILAAARARGGDDRNATKFLSELGWREFSYHLLGNFPDLDQRNFNVAFDAFPWRHDQAALKAWRKGQTGYPIVDAGMRELWTTGTMHNRVRMIVASFLTKHLLIDWRHGEAWFWDTLVDADPANNAAGWQWVAGCGADAAPYFRIFNPVLQGEKFDPDGAYTRRWLPELGQVPPRLLQKPWEMAPLDLLAAGVRLGETYPRPVVDHARARQRALDAHEAMKRGGE